MALLSFSVPAELRDGKVPPPPPEAEQRVHLRPQSKQKHTVPAHQLPEGYGLNASAPPAVLQCNSALQRAECSEIKLTSLL